MVAYDTITGGVIKKHTHQGVDDESAWARGQAWGLYGFTMVYRETNQNRFLDQAVKIAEFYLNHPNLPKDMIPYWDFNAPGIPHEPRDVSAAAVTCSALFELANYVPADKQEKYRKAAVKMLQSMSSSAYLASEQTPAPFILLHSTGHKPKNSEVDVPLIYADYYYLEALTRYQDLLKGKHASKIATPGAPAVVTMDGTSLAALKEKTKQQPAVYADVVNSLKREADEYLNKGPYTITAKTSLPPSGSKHDYESQGPYWWPNPNSPNGLPYIRRDGEKNPEIENLKDHTNMDALMKATKTLGLSYFFTGEEVYANHAALLLRTWFINDDTRMNPNLNFGQRIPGITDGRDIGIIELRYIGDILDGVALIGSSKEWTDVDQARMENWAKRYLTWLLHSKNGIGEKGQHNNHGSWYDVQVAALAIFVGEEEIAKQAIIRTKDERLPKHIEPDGRQPHELARTRSWGYSVMNLQSFFMLASMGEKVGIDLWNYSTSDGRNIQKALDYLVPFAKSGGESWSYQQITKFDSKELVPLLYQASCKYPKNIYLKTAIEISKEEDKLERYLMGCETILH